MNTHRTQRRVWFSLALALVTGIVASGCGSDSESGDDANSKSNSASSDAASTETKKADETQASAALHYGFWIVWGVSIMRLGMKMKRMVEEQLKNSNEAAS